MAAKNRYLERIHLHILAHRQRARIHNSLRPFQEKAGSASPVE
jgi:hypothetical protein